MLLDKNVEIKNTVDATIQINTIPAYFESTLFSLISKAIKYKALKRKAIVEIAAIKKEDQTHISIKDNRIGIDLKLNNDKIVEVYKTFHGNEVALGYGCFRIKNHIEALGGKNSIKK